MTRALVEIEEKERLPARDIEAKHVIDEALNALRTRFYKVIELSDLQDEDTRDRLLERWKREVAKFARALTGLSMKEWMSREDQVIVFNLARLARSAKLIPVDALGC
jgi:hypothetical protein